MMVLITFQFSPDFEHQRQMRTYIMIGEKKILRQNLKSMDVALEYDSAAKHG